MTASSRLRAPGWLWLTPGLLLGAVPPAPAATQALELVREIGSAEGARDYTFFRISDLAVSDGGEVLVLDSGDRSVAVYDSLGTFLRRIGRAGSGPGEFVRPTRIELASDGLVVHDPQLARVTRLSATGEVLDTRALPRPAGLDLSRMYEMRDGSVVAGSVFRAALGGPEHDPFIRVVRFAGESPVDTLLMFEVGAVLWSAPAGLPWGIAPTSLGPTGAWAVSGDSLLALVDATRSELRLVRFTGAGPTVLATGRLPVTARPVGEGELREIEREVRRRSPNAPGRIQLTAPSWVSELTGRALFDDRGGVWVETRPSGEGPHRWAVIDHGSPRGRWVAMPERFRLMAVRGGKAYGVWRDELEVQTIRVYELPLP
jgi:hypothetical protein